MIELSDLQKEPRGPRLFDSWILGRKIPSALGEFQVSFYPDSGVPDQEMVARANHLVGLLDSEHGQLAALVFENYRHACTDPDWMSELGVAIDLSEAEACRLLSVRSISIRRDSGELESRFYFRPDWDEEHGIYIDPSARRFRVVDV